MSVNLLLEAPRPQRRVTIALRLLFAIPTLLLASVLMQVAQILIVVAWFAALFTKRVPDGLSDFLAKCLRYAARSYAYGFLLMSDVYPPWEIDGDAPYPVDLEVDITEEHNRAAVLFRMLLMTPKLIVLTIVQVGLAVAIFFFWLVALVNGRLPDSVFEAHAAILRYQMRVYAYVGLITSEYPRRLFGDPPEEVEVDHALALTLDEDGEPLPRRARTLDLSRGAKVLIAVLLLLGSLLPIGIGAVSIAVALDVVTAGELNERHLELQDAIEQWSVDVQGCSFSGGPECLRSANGRLQVALERFERDLDDLEIPSRAELDAEAVHDDVRELIAILDDMNRAADLASYQEHASRFIDVATDFDRDFERLYDNVLF